MYWNCNGKSQSNNRGYRRISGNDTFVHPTSGSIKIDEKESGKDIEVLCDEIFRFDKGKLVIHEY